MDGGVLRIGALTRHAELLASPLVGDVAPVLHDAERSIADAIVRNRGTVGGSVCQADPSEDLSGAFCALRASAVIRGERETRTVPMREFFEGPYQTAVGPAEILVELQVPLWATGSAYVKVDRRAGDWAVAAAAAAVRTADGVITDAGIGLTAVGPFVAAEAEASVIGRPPTEETFAVAGRLAAEHCRPSADQRGPVDYKRHLAGELTVRALRKAASCPGRCDVEVTVVVNGRAERRDVEPRLLLVHLLRDELGLTGTHWGCDTSNCGACVVWLDDVPVKSCTVFAATADGHAVRTVEGLAPPGGLDPVQRAFIDCHGLQCGFCTPAMLLTARWLLDHTPDPTDEEIRTAIAGITCRCTGYANIVKAIRQAAAS